MTNKPAEQKTKGIKRKGSLRCKCNGGQTFCNTLGKLEYFTNLNISAIKGDDSPIKKNHHLW